jgi:hypothetical protein
MKRHPKKAHDWSERCEGTGGEGATPLGGYYSVKLSSNLHLQNNSISMNKMMKLGSLILMAHRGDLPGNFRHFPFLRRLAELGRVARLTGCLIPMISSLPAATLFLDASLAGSGPGEAAAFAGTKAPFTLRLTSSELMEPELRADLFALNAGTMAPLASDLDPDLHRIELKHPGVQSFGFSIDIPAVQRNQRLLLKLQVRTSDNGEWLPLPPIMLEAVLSTWEESLRQFAARYPIGRVNGGTRLAAVFARAHVEATEAEADALTTNPSVRVWFAESTEGETDLVAAPGAIMVVFRNVVRGGFEIARTGSTVRILIDAATLVTLDRNPAAQETLGRALAAATALLPPQPTQN